MTIYLKYLRLALLLAVLSLPVAHSEQTSPLLFGEKRAQPTPRAATRYNYNDVRSRSRFVSSPIVPPQQPPATVTTILTRENSTATLSSRPLNRSFQVVSRPTPIRYEPHRSPPTARRVQFNNNNNDDIHNRAANLEQDSEQELLCLVKLYVDTYVDHNINHVGFVDMNDRLVFLVPLIIIYWHHRHPHEPVPYADIDGVLRDIGEEGQDHRQVLRDVIRKVSGQQQYCSPQSSGLGQPDSEYQRANQQRAAEALRILKEWLGDSEQLVVADSSSDGGGVGSGVGAGNSSWNTNRLSSNGREIRNWFQALANLHRHPPTSPDRTSTTTRRPSYVTLDPSNFISTTTQPKSTTTSTSTRPSTTTIAAESNPSTPSGASRRPTNESLHGDASSELYGMPQVGNKTTHPFIVKSEDEWRSNATLSTQDNTNQNPVSTISMSNSNLMEQLKDIQMSLSVANVTRGEQPKLNATHYSEFFELVSSIIGEIENIHNATLVNF